MPKPEDGEAIAGREPETLEKAPRDATGRALEMATRVVLGAAGAGLVIGFFLPWIRLGEVMSMSGFSLSVTGGEATAELAGPSGGLLFVVPLSGAFLVFAAIRGLRGVAWIGLASGFVIFAVGLYTLISVFLDSTGGGMWVVATSAVLAVLVGLLGVRRRR